MALKLKAESGKKVTFAVKMSEEEDAKPIEKIASETTGEIIWANVRTVVVNVSGYENLKSITCSYKNADEETIVREITESTTFEGVSGLAPFVVTAEPKDETDKLKYICEGEGPYGSNDTTINIIGSNVRTYWYYTLEKGDYLKAIEYSFDNANWTSISDTTTLKLNWSEVTRLYFRGVALDATYQYFYYGTEVSSVSRAQEDGLTSLSGTRSALRTYTVTYQAKYGNTVLNTGSVTKTADSVVNSSNYYGDTYNLNAQHYYTSPTHSGDKTVTSDMTITTVYATQNTHTYTVTYQAKYGDTIINTQTETKEYGAVVNSNSKYTATFDLNAQYFYTSPTHSGNVTVTGDTTVTTTYGTENIHTYTVTYQAKYGDTILNTQTATKAYGRTVNSTDKYSATYDLNAQYYYTSPTHSGEQTVTSDITITATYETQNIHTYTVTYNAKYNGTVFATQTETKSYGDTVNSSDKYGSSFDHNAQYYYERGTVSGDKTVTGDLTVATTYAIRQIHTYKVTIRALYGSTIVASATTLKSYGDIVNSSTWYGTTYTEKPDYDYSSPTYSGDKTVTGTLTIDTTYATRSDLKSYTVIYQAKRGETIFTTSSKIKTYGTSVSSTEVYPVTYNYSDQYSYSGGSGETKTVTGDTTVTTTYTTGPTTRKYAVTFFANSYSTAFTSTSSTATSGNPSGTTYDYGTTVYVFYIMNEDTAQYTYTSNEGTLISGRIYRVTSLTVGTSNGFGTVPSKAPTRTTNGYKVIYRAIYSGSVVGSTSENKLYGTSVNSSDKYGSTFTPDAQYTYSSPTYSGAKTVNGELTVDTTYATRTTRSYTVFYRAVRNGSVVASTTATKTYGTTVSSTDVYPTNWNQNAQYNYSGGTGETKTVTGDTIVDTTYAAGPTNRSYTVTIRAIYNGSVVSSTTSTQSYGATVNSSSWYGSTHTPNAQYTYSSATYSGNKTVSGDMTIDTTYGTRTTRSYTVTIRAIYDGSVVGSTTATKNYGDSVNSSSWFGSSYTPDAQYTYSSPTYSGAKTVTGTLTIDTTYGTRETRGYTVTIRALYKGSYITSTTSAQLYGATVNSSSWYGASYSTAEYGYTSPSYSGNKTVTGNMTIDTNYDVRTKRSYTITFKVAHPSLGTMIVTSGVYEYGTVVYASWGCGDSINWNAQYYIYNPADNPSITVTGDGSVTRNYSTRGTRSYSFTYEAYYNSTYLASKGTTATYGQTVWASWGYGDTYDVSGNTRYVDPNNPSTTVYGAGYSVRRTYTRTQYYVTVSGGTGVAWASGTGWYYAGSSMKVSAGASSGYSITSGPGTYTINGPRTINVYAAQNKPQLQAAHCSENGYASMWVYNPNSVSVSVYWDGSYKGSLGAYSGSSFDGYRGYQYWVVLKASGYTDSDGTWGWTGDDEC